MRKQMEGDNEERRAKAREAREQGSAPSAEMATTGASKQRRHLERDEPHVEKLESIRRGKPPMTVQKQPRPRPGSKD